MTTSSDKPRALAPDQRARLEQIRAAGLKYVDHQAAIHEDASKAGMLVDVEYRYLVLNAASAALEADDRARDAAARDREVRVTLAVAIVAALATAVQAVAMAIDLVRQ
jgi:hypothetical protein